MQSHLSSSAVSALYLSTGAGWRDHYSVAPQAIGWKRVKRRQARYERSPGGSWSKEHA